MVTKTYLISTCTLVTLWVGGGCFFYKLHPVQNMLTATAVQRVLAAYRNQLIQGSRDKERKQKESPGRDPGLGFTAVAGASNAKGTSKKKKRANGSSGDIGLMSSDDRF